MTLELDIKKDSVVPIYEQIVNGVKEAINRGDLEPSQKLESEKNFARKLKISRGTLRKAISILCDKGYLKKKHGKGTFVSGSENDITYPLDIGLHSFAEVLSSHHLVYTTLVIKQELRKASKLEAKNLNIPEGHLYLYLERLRKVQDGAVMLIENRINIDEIPELDHSDFTKKSLFNEIERLSKSTIQFSKSTFGAVTAGNRRAKLLGIQGSDPVLKMQQVVYLSENVPIEFGTVWLKGNKYLLTTTSKR